MLFHINSARDIRVLRDMHAVLRNSSEALANQFKQDLNEVGSTIADGNPQFALLTFAQRLKLPKPAKPQPELTATPVSVNHEGENTGTYPGTFLIGNWAINPPGSWSAFIGLVCDVLHTEHPNDFEEIALAIRSSRGRKYVSRDPNELTRSEAISGTDLRVESNLSANNAVNFAVRLTECFGYENPHFAK